jgi:hypothetical protein
MERRFTMNDFERSLKEQADDFKMIPSKRVWHGIYNDLHPGRRWPSYTMSFLLIFSLLFIGYLNSNQKTRQHPGINTTSFYNTTGKNLISEDNVASSKISIKQNGKNLTTSSKVTDLISKTGFLNYRNSAGTISSENYSQPAFSENNTIHNYVSQLPDVANISDFGIINIGNLEGQIIAPNYLKSKLEYGEITFMSEKKVGKISSDEVNIGPNGDLIRPHSLNNSLYSGKLLVIKKIDKIKTTSQKLQNASKKSQLPAPNKKSKWSYYLTPEISTVTFRGHPITQPPGINYSASVNVSGGYEVLHYKALGFETGAQVKYRFTRKLSFTSGVQLSYSGYNIISNEVHPTFTTLLLRDPSSGAVYPRSYISHYGDGQGQTAVSLRNYSLQASVPVGIAYEIYGGKNVQLNVATNIAPSMIIKGNAFVLSSDGNNYLNDPTLLRKWNFSSDFGLYVTFRSKHHEWQIGPNLRYQWLSTYKNEYSIHEHLIDYGLRIGISR